MLDDDQLPDPAKLGDDPERWAEAFMDALSLWHDATKEDVQVWFTAALARRAGR